MLLQKGNILFPAITAAAADLGEGVRPHLFKGALRTPRSAQEALQTWSAENGWSEKRSAELPERTGYRKIPCNHCRTGSEKVRHKPKD